MEFLANDFVTIYKSEDPKNIYPYTPGIPGVYIASLQKRKRVRLSSRQPMCGTGPMSGKRILAVTPPCSG